MDGNHNETGRGMISTSPPTSPVSETWTLHDSGYRSGNWKDTEEEGHSLYFYCLGRTIPNTLNILHYIVHLFRTPLPKPSIICELLIIGYVRLVLSTTDKTSFRRPPRGNGDLNLGPRNIRKLKPRLVERS